MSMAKLGTTRSFTLYEKAIEVLDQRSASNPQGYVMGEGTRNYSKAIGELIDRYDYIVKHNVPKFSAGEWKIIVEAIGGQLVEAWAIGHVTAGIVDSISLDGAAERFEVDGEAMIKKLKKLGYVQKLAMVDVVECYWAAHVRGENPELPGG